MGSLVPTNGVTIFSGEGGIGKSFIALDLALQWRAARSRSFRLQSGPVIYIDLENDEGTIGRRLKQLGIGRGIDPATPPLYLPRRGMPGVELQQDTPEGRAWLWAIVRKYKPRLVVIDSLIACHSGDENNNVLMRQLVGGLDGLARAGEMGLLWCTTSASERQQRRRPVVGEQATCATPSCHTSRPGGLRMTSSCCCMISATGAAREAIQSHHSRSQ